jgi:uncharacterized membrane protein
MTPSLPRRFVVAYAILLALADLTVPLPGNPYASSGELIAAVAVQALVAWRLWHASSLAWLLAMFFAAGGLLTLILMQPRLELGVVLWFLSLLAQVLVLWMYALALRSSLSAREAGTPAKGAT